MNEICSTHRKVTSYSPDSVPPLLCPDLQPAVLVHQNPWFKVMSRDSFFTLEYDEPQVVVLPILDNHSIIMIRVKRPVIGDVPLELPAGGSYKGESPRMATMRELAEETGIVITDPDRFVPELPFGEMPGRIPVLLSVFRVDVTKAEYEARRSHDNEVVSVEAVTFGDAVRKITSGEIYLTSPTAIIARFLFDNDHTSREKA